MLTSSNFFLEYKLNRNQGLNYNKMKKLHFLVMDWVIWTKELKYM